MGYFTRFKNRLKKPGYFKEHEVRKVRKQSRFVNGSINLYGHDFNYHDGLSFHDSYNEIIAKEMYLFETKQEKPLILDCGANMGVSVLFFALNYPKATIHAFEPEVPIFEVLQKNKNAYGWPNVTLHQMAVWNSETTLEFYTDHGMGGSVENVYKKQKPTKVRTIRLADYLQQQVAMLKMDIEGAEYQVLKDCESFLHNVENIFVEYHSFSNKEQHLDDILTMFKQHGFRYHLRQSFSRKKPFINRNNICDNFDMAINVFAYR